jgi:hypothetical protein
MGPYCKFCDHRCFVQRVIPDGPDAGTHLILATCAAGMAHDRQMTGHDHTSAINPLAATRWEPEPSKTERALLALVNLVCLPFTLAWAGLERLEKRGVRWPMRLAAGTLTPSRKISPVLPALMPSLPLIVPVTTTSWRTLVTRNSRPRSLRSRGSTR